MTQPEALVTLRLRKRAEKDKIMEVAWEYFYERNLDTKIYAKIS